MKLFKHKITGDVVKEHIEISTGEKTYTNYVHTIPALFVENSNDWQEVKEPLFISDDGVEMYNGADIYFVINFEISNYIGFVSDYIKKEATPNCKRFSTKEAALKYIDLNKPKYSKSDVIDALRIAEYYSGFRKPSGEEVIKHLFGE